MPRLKFTAVPKPGGATRLQGINIEYSDTTLHFAPRPLGAGKVMFPEKFCMSVNDLLSNFDADDHLALYGIYQTLADIREMPRITIDDMFVIEQQIEDFFNIITQERIEAWGRNYKGYAIPSSLDTISPMRDDGVSNSCTPDEYVDICILSTLMKLLIPFQDVAPHVATYIPDEFAENWGLFKILNSAGMIEEYPAYQRCIEKTAAKAETILGPGVPTGLTAKGCGEEQFYRIIFIPKLFRDVTRLETEVEMFEGDINNNISFKINRSIENRINNDIRGAYSFRLVNGSPQGDGEDGNTTHQEDKAGGERISSIYGMYFTRDFENFVNVVNDSSDFPDEFKFQAEDISKLAAKMPKRLTWSEAQSTLTGVIFDKVIPIEADDYCPPSCRMTVMAYGALIMEKLNLPNLRTLLLTNLDNQGQFTESESRNSVLTNRLVHPRVEEVMAQYPDEQSGNPFVIACDHFARSVVRANHVIAVGHDGLQVGTEWFPKIINDMGIKDELCELMLHLNPTEVDDNGN